jgi:S-DNA-T family DNA segregation ATPase FtsK/SpoIIIE
VQVGPFADARPAPARPAQASVATDSGRTELDVLTESLAEQAAARGISAPRALWLPPLPELLPPSSLPPLPAAEPTGRRRRGPDLRIRLGLADEPEQVAQPLMTADLGAEGHLLVVGAYGAGKTSTLRHVAAELAGRLGPDRLHMYGIDAGDDSLGPLAALPQTADVVGAEDLERLLPLFARLERIVAERRADPDATVERPAIVLLLDDVAAFRETSDSFQYGVLLERLVSLLRSGPSVDVHVVLSAAQRTDLPSAIFNLFARKVLLRQTDRLDYDLIGVPPSARPADAPPGRAMVSGSPPRETQIAFTDADAVEALVACLAEEAGPRPAPIARLPRELPLGDLLAVATPDAFVLGRGGPEGEPVLHDVERDGPVLLVAGGERSGRSTTLLAAAAGLRAGRPDAPVTVLAVRRSPVRALGDGDGVRVATTPDEALLAIGDLAVRPAGSPALLFVDDLESLGDGALMALEPVLRNARESSLVAVVAGRSADLARSFDPATRYLRSLRSTLVLMPRAEDGELVGSRIPPLTGPQVPGRGLLYRGTGDPVRLQVGLPD